MEQQNNWINSDGYIKNMVYRSDLDHPMSMHNTVTGNNIKVQFPKTEDQMANIPKYSLNGYFARDPTSLKDGFQTHDNKFVQPVDNRMFNENETFHKENHNQLYHPNQELL